MNNNISTITLDYEKLLRWFRTTTFDDDSVTVTGEAYLMFQDFGEIYRDKTLGYKKSSDTPAQIRLLQRYQAHWEWLFNRGETILTPIPEAYYAMIVASTMLDKSLVPQFEKYSKYYYASKYYIRTGAESVRLGDMMGGIDNIRDANNMYEPPGSSISADGTDEDIEKTLMSIFKADKPRCLSQMITSMSKQASISSVRSDPESIHTCILFYHSLVYLGWSQEEKKAFDDFYNHPVNRIIMAIWETNKMNGAGSKTPLNFPTACPNGLNEKNMKFFIGYYETDRFTRMTKMLTDLRLPYN
ncbi:hypothetical protein JCM33374_g4996 [Metschnikowia sp. JCM 33374]|nr:hypothetical protein JCM33374_g4996 [Metschnikowia sp. JCM 33374]